MDEVPIIPKCSESDLRDEKKCLASEAAAYTHYLKSVRERKQKIPEPGDLVLVSNHAVDGQRGRKLEAKWLGPRILVSYSASKVSAHVGEIYGDKTKKHHLNDIVLYGGGHPDTIPLKSVRTLPVTTACSYEQNSA